jgi:hypothetical protein
MDVVVWLRSLGLGKYGRRRARCRYHRFASRAHEKNDRKHVNAAVAIS